MSERIGGPFASPAVFFVNGFGDQVMALPTMRALATLFPQGMQLLLGEGMLSFFYRGLPVGEPSRVWWANFDEIRIDVERTAQSAGPCDLFLSLSTWSSPSVSELARKLKARCTVGFFETFDEFVAVDEPAHMCDRLFSIPQRLQPALRVEDFSWAPRFSAAAENAAERFVRKRVPPGHRILFVHPETLTYKMWSPAHFSWVVERFLEARPDFTVFVASLHCYPLQIERNRDRVVFVDEHLELVLSILRHADLFLGIDSCFLHAADLFRITGVGLFGPTDPRVWGFRLSPHARCIYGNGTMEPIRREDVFEAMIEMSDQQLRGDQPAAALMNESLCPAIYELVSQRRRFRAGPGDSILPP